MFVISFFQPNIDNKFYFFYETKLAKGFVDFTGKGFTNSIFEDPLDTILRYYVGDRSKAFEMKAV